MITTSPIRTARILFAFAAATCLAIIIMLAGSVARDLTELRAAKRDSVQWTLSQVEIEYLDLKLSLERADASDSPDLRQLRKDFDVFYSRISIISEGALFQEVRKQGDFNSAIAEVDGFLNWAIPYIDAKDAVLVDALGTMDGRASPLRDDVRALYISGLSYFAESADMLRNRLASTMLQLSAAAGTLLILLAVLTFYSQTTNRQLLRQRQALKSANARMETILSTSLDAVIVSDEAGKIIEFNEVAEEIFGYDAQAAKGQLIRDLIVPQHLRDAHQAGMERMASTGEKKLVGKGHIQISACRKDGSEFPVELALESASTEDGDIIIAFIRDISARVKNEEDLKTARDQALAGEKAKADFLAVMSHEIRTPLNGLLGNLTLLGDTRLSREQKQFQGNMEISGRQLMKHVNAVLDVARFESGKMPVRLSAFHIGALIQEIVDSQSSRAESNQTTLSWTWVSDPVEWIMSDRNHVEQILMNLIGNAIKFTKGGRVDIEVEAFGDTLDIRVMDTGVGIPEADQERVFKDFESRGQTGGTRGTGLGLGIAKRLVDLLKGEIGVESDVGVGSVFWISLPLHEVEAPRETALASQKNAPLLGMHILLAEDNDMNAFVAQKMLEKEGHKITIATDGLQAFHMASEEKFDAILMDINMPVMDGLEATQKIRAEIKGAKTLPILAFSANVLPEDKDKFLQMGMDGFIGKPIQMEELRSALETVSALHVRPTMKGSSAPIPTNEAKDLMGANYDAFLDRFKSEADALISWLKLGDTPHGEVEHLCHKLVSTAAMFGARDFQEALRSSENAAKRGDKELHIDKLIETWAKTRDAL